MIHDAILLTNREREIVAKANAHRQRILGEPALPFRNMLNVILEQYDIEINRDTREHKAAGV